MCARAHPSRAMTIANPERRKELRRSTRVPIRVRIDVEDTGLSCERETIVVNLHGALLKTSGQPELGARITVYVQLSWDADTRLQLELDQSRRLMQRIPL